jgi:hypothetical protein
MTCSVAGVGIVRFHGTVLLLVHDAEGRPSLAHVVDGSHLDLAGRTVLATSDPPAARTVGLA